MQWLLILCVVWVCQAAYVSKTTKRLFETDYYPTWKKLYLEEGNSNYPLPPSSAVKGLLPTFKGVKGIAVHTSPGETVTEGQGYAMFAAGMSKDITSLKGLAVAWQAMGQAVAGTPLGGCNGTVPAACICHTVPGAYTPAWKYPITGCAPPGCTGSAPDGDEDAITGLIYLAELTNDEQIREYAVKSVVAFILNDLGGGRFDDNSRKVPVVGDIPVDLQRMFLWRGGSCWGGYCTKGPASRNLCINPSYFSPGQWRLFSKYITKHSHYIPSGHSLTNLTTVVHSSITWGYNLMYRISCSSGLVTNWWTLPNSGWPWEGKLKCSASGTAPGAYGADACRTPWRMSLDNILWGDEAKVQIYDEQGKELKMWGSQDYANGWSSEYVARMKKINGSCPASNCVHVYNAIPLLRNWPSCKDCPEGFRASPWNAWGYFPPLSTFSVPNPEMAESQQQWVDLMTGYLAENKFPTQYYDQGQKIMVSALMGGLAWVP